MALDEVLDRDTAGGAPPRAVLVLGAVLALGSSSMSLTQKERAQP